jgi:hypothetical protein
LKEEILFALNDPNGGFCIVRWTDMIRPRKQGRIATEKEEITKLFHNNISDPRFLAYHCMKQYESALVRLARTIFKSYPSFGTITRYHGPVFVEDNNGLETENIGKVRDPHRRQIPVSDNAMKSLCYPGLMDAFLADQYILENTDQYIYADENSSEQCFHGDFDTFAECISFSFMRCLGRYGAKLSIKCGTHHRAGGLNCNPTNLAIYDSDMFFLESHFLQIAVKRV